MKIAVISLKVNANYGGILQAWALQKTLTRMGHEVVLIDTKGPTDLPLLQKIYKYPWRVLMKYLINSTKPIRHERLCAEHFKELMKNLMPFINSHISRKIVNGIGDLRGGDYDAIIFGSDQVWRPKYARSFLGSMENAFGYFAKDWRETALIAYAASFGVDTLDEYDRNEMKRITEVLPRFKGVSVREMSGVALCRQLGVSAVNVLDPTLLFNKHDYLKLIERAEQPVTAHEGIMTYILDATEETDQIVNRISQLKGLPTFSSLPLYGEAPESVEQWLEGFRDADMIVTDSFHACVFSIIFSKPFVVLSNHSRGTTRIDSLLSAFGLESNRIHNIPSTLNMIRRPDTHTIEHLQSLRHTSLNFLKSTLAQHEIFN